MTSYVLFSLYIAAAIVNVVARLLVLDAVAMYSKVLLMPLLIAYVYEAAKKNVTLLVLLLCAALIFSWGGDVALLYEGDTYFLLGMGSFLIAQLIYAYLFKKSIQLKIHWKWWYIAPVLLLTIGFLSQVLPKAGAFQIPIAVYALAISVMAIAAIARHGKVGEKSFKLVVAGAIIFVISDCTIAWNKFVMPFELADAFVMLTYTTAQLLIVRGILIQKWRIEIG
ncbi:MAG: lysoplasmalogenase [Cytophagales bacterium]|nr:lysoplasmalogenase [Cytophagales bacterium]